MAGEDPYDPDRAFDAMSQALASGDPARIAQVVDDYAWTLAAHHHGLLEEALRVIPSELFERFERLKLVHPVASVLARMYPKQPAARDKVDVLALSDDELNEHLLKQVIARRLSGDVKSAVDVAERLEERLERGGGTGRLVERCPVGQVSFQLGVTYLLDGQTQRALSSFSLAGQLSALAPGYPLQRDCVVRSAVTHALRGAVRHAERALTAARQLPSPPPFFASYTQTAENIAAAFIEVERLGPDAESRVAALESYDAIDELWPLIALVRARFELARAHPMAALEEISMAFATHTWSKDTLADDVRVSCTAESFLSLGEVASARSVCEEASGRLPLSQIAMIRVLIHEGRFAEAARACRRLRGAREVSPATRAHAILLRAWVAFEADGAIDPSEARAIARIAWTGDFRRMFTTVPQALIEAIHERIPEQESARLANVLEGLEFAAPLPERPRLSPSEMNVLNELARSTKTAEIAERLHVTPNTVKTQLASIYRKLGVRSRADAITAATRMNLIRGEADEGHRSLDAAGVNRG